MPVTIGLCMALCSALVFYSWKIEPGILPTKTVDIANSLIKKNCTIVFMADLHLPISKRLERKLQNALIKNKPDIILIGGDFSSYRTEASYSIEKLKMLARYGKVIIVLGNTDLCGSRQCVYCAMKYPIDRLDRLPATILRNDSIVMPDLGIKVFGLDDPVTNQDDTTVIQSVQGPYYTILLLHSVYKLTDDQKQRFDLICSGHSHGGQVFFLRPFLHAFDDAIDQRYISGFYIENKSAILVTSGVGTSVLPFRMGVPPEIVVIHLRK
jgi:predicted MPP superfamily phosphohydrolase